MKEKIIVAEYAGKITESLPKGILLNSRYAKFNSMVIGWGGLGIVWGKPVFTVYVREHRYTKAQLDATGEFTISVPVDGIIPSIAKICGTQSGRDVDKETAAHLTLEPPEVIHVPGIKEYPLTLEILDPAFSMPLTVLFVQCGLLGAGICLLMVPLSRH